MTDYSSLSKSNRLLCLVVLNYSVVLCYRCIFCFFFQAEDGIRDDLVTGVQTCALPISCLFIYSFDGRTVRPKWLGSSLSRPFVDFAFANLDRDRAEELISIETTRQGKRDRKSVV